MENKSRLYQWFWNRPIFRNLRPRLMTMMAALVLPVCVLCIAISLGAVIQGARLTYIIEANGFSMYMDKVMIGWEYEGMDVTGGFPQNASAAAAVLYSAEVLDRGSIYVSIDGLDAFLVHPDGTCSQAEEKFPDLIRSRHRFYWEGTDNPLRVLVVFPYHFALASVPVWFWFAIAFSLLTLAFLPLLYSRLKQDILIPMGILRNATEKLQEDHAYRIPDQSWRIADDFLKQYESFNRMAEEVQASHEKDMKMLETEMENLRLQVNPHMLLNSYNMIYALAESKNYPVIQDYTLCLVDYF
ncbi:MAG: histidine kinase, partial [Parasporobacterium sp.]|nr:histidine kinase [Parasporobacterium sp.]